MDRFFTTFHGSPGVCESGFFSDSVRVDASGRVTMHGTWCVYNCNTNGSYWYYVDLTVTK